MTAAGWWGALCGLGIGCGAVLLWAGLPLRGRIDLAARIEPYLDRGPRRRLGVVGAPTGAWRVRDLVDRASSRLARGVGSLLGGASSVEARLQRAGLAPDVEAFRIQQVLWGIAVCSAAAGLGSLLWWFRGVSVVALAVVVACSFLGGAMLRDLLLSQQARRREGRMMGEFPAVAEMLALAVTAGEGTVQALERVARLSDGELAAELDLCLADARTGANLPDALRAMGTRTGLPALNRFVDGLIVAVERGTPLGEVLRAQAADAREAARQALIEEGGRKEISMMVPVVFLVLPVTVLFAVFPGVSLLRVSL